MLWPRGQRQPFKTGIEGLVTGTARPIHLGRRSHVWEIHLENDKGKLTCVSKLTLAIVAIE